MSELASLQSLQSWLQTVIIDGGASDLAPVRASNRLPARTRVAVYIRGYRQRLIECLQKEFPILRGLVGDEVFDMLALGYVEACPSHSYTLFDFGAGFAPYLESKRPPDVGDVGGVPSTLARIERAKTEVYRARGHETDRQPDSAPFLLSLVAQPISPRRPDTLRLLALPYDFGDMLAAFARKEALALPPVAQTFLAVVRSGFRVACHPLEVWQYDWLTSLPEEGDDSVESSAAPAAGQDARLADWLPEAMARGMLISRAP